MSKICKRIIALIAASCLVVVSCPVSWASEEEYVAQHRPTVWEYIIDGTDSTVRRLFNAVVGAFVGTDYCAFTDSHKHEGTEVVSKTVDDNGEYVFQIRCTGCGSTFLYRGSDAQSQYNNAVHDNGLDNGMTVSPDGGLIWRSTPADLSGDKRNILGFSGTRPDGSSTGTYYLQLSSSSYSSSSWTSSFSLSSLNTNTFFVTVSYNYESGYYASSPKCYSIGALNIPVRGIYNYIPNSISFSTGGSLDRTFSFDASNKTYIDFSYAYFSAGSLNIPSGTSATLSCSFPSFRVTPSSSISIPTVPSTININNTTYNVTDIDFGNREIHVEPNITINYGDEKVTIQEGDTIINEITYIIEEDDPDPDPDPGDGSSSDPGTDPGTGDSSDPYCNWTPEMWEQLKVLLRQNNTFLEQIYTELTNISELVGDNSGYDFTGMYNLIVEIRNALQDIEANPPPDYSQKLEVVANQLANIWGDVQDIKQSLQQIATNTDITNNKLDSVHDDLEDVLAELQEQKGILRQILDALQKILSHVVSIDENVEELSTEENTNNFLLTIVNKFGFVNQIYGITVQMFKDITSDAVTSQDVSNGVIPVGDVTPVHAPSYGGAATAPQVLCEFPEVTWNGMNFGGYTALDLSWYAPYKPKVDAILSGFFWLSYIYMLFKRLPAIIHGEAMTND